MTECERQSPCIQLEIDLQLALDENDDPEAVPERAQIQQWLQATLLAEGYTAGQLTVRIVGRDEMTYLNSHYRHCSGVTNVLSFCCDCGHLLQPRLLGDIVICASQVLVEAGEQAKLPENHWAHLMIHGCLHLLGYDHQLAAEAEVMEAAEGNILAGFSIADPYLQGPLA